MRVLDGLVDGAELLLEVFRRFLGLVVIVDLLLLLLFGLLGLLLFFLATLLLDRLLECNVEGDLIKLLEVAGDRYLDD